jgi:galactonate dehydratase
VKITAVETIQVGVNHRGDWLFVRIETDDGLVGYGEASHGGGFGRDAVVTAILQNQCRPVLLGRDPRSVLAAVAAIRFVADGRAGATALSACEQALWDLAGKAAGVPVYRLLGGPLTERIPLYANINRATTDRTPRGFAQNAASAVAEGFTAVKCAPFDGMDQRRVQEKDQQARVRAGLDCLGAVREAVGPDIDVLVDCHEHFDVPTALAVAQELCALGITWFEEPVPTSDIEALTRLRPLVPDLELIGGEALFGVQGFWPYLAAGLWDVVMPDVKHCGGIASLLTIARLADERGTACAPHNPSGPIAMAASAHVAAATPRLRSLEVAWGEVDWRAGLTVPNERIVDGMYELSPDPGFGVALNGDEIARHPAGNRGY